MFEKKFHVKDLIFLSSLEGVKVLAGWDQLGNIINNVCVMEVPDVEDWVLEDEFLMTTGYMFQNHIESFLSLIPKLSERNIAALGIKPKRYIDEIPSAVIECAQNYNLPLLALPAQTTFSLVIREVMEKILLSDLRKEERIVYQMLHSNEVTKEELLNVLSSVDIYPSKEASYHVILPLEHEKDRFCDINMIKRELQSGMQDYNIKILATEHETTAVFICISDKESDWDACLATSPNPFTESAKKHKISFFISEPQSELLRLNETYVNVKDLFFSAKASSLDKDIITWQSLGIYSALPFLEKTPFYYYVMKKYIEPLTTYDKEHGTSLFQTLQTYIEFDGNMRAAAKHLYIHYNTMCYRMNVIKENFLLNLSDIDELTCLNLAFKLYLQT